MHRRTGRILVVGAGIVGATAAYHLTRAGYRVTVIEGAGVAGGVTGDSFAWIGFAKSSAATAAHGLRRTAAEDFARVASELRTPIGLRRTGALTWESTDAATRAFVSEHQRAGHPVRLVDAEEIRRREPGVREVPAVAAFAPDDGGVDPAALTAALLQEALDDGAALRTGTRVRGLIAEGGAVTGVATDAGPVHGSAVLLAAGTGIPPLLASLGIAEPIGASPAPARVEASPCCLLRFSTPTPLVSGILSSPDFEIRQLDDTTLIAAEDVPRSGFDGDTRRLAQPTLASIRRLLVGGKRVELIDAVVADRPVTDTGEPLLGFAPGVSGLYLASAHPAIMLMGTIGARIARDFMSADRD
ncbi:FAD-binding oxidoreductase [Leucobacter rhizosphaerae]|uniref:FAD-binding oxidoreductase n=1 Tax=Leucobacter rhizosphaerae TaxID=2932245 RepID=A0ABY4FTP5_9MICO|nr:FAD-binding oxidoreductase [Leucobacter rhizosphaerae]UOQ59675.1 FAD-binding oxidoreductase [Leucobacter rhizosphaerae]